MAVVRTLMLVIGLLAVAFGLLFILQGLGIVHWPRSVPSCWKIAPGRFAARSWWSGGALMAWFGRKLR